MALHYKIEFFSYWHSGSGLSAGADVDVLVLKDKNNLPYISGKTIKGLIREAVEDTLYFKGEEKEVLFRKTFGYFKASKDDMVKGEAFFTNIELSENIQKAIIENNISKFLYSSVSSTAIDENGIAINHSLRKMQTVVPCSLEGAIINVPDDFVTEIETGLKFIKRLGQNRNRGLGRCQISVVNKETKGSEQ